MSADNYLFVTRGRGNFEGGFPVYHLFASADDIDLARKVPLFIGYTRDDALSWAYEWARRNVCEYGVYAAEGLFEQAAADQSREAAQATRERES